MKPAESSRILVAMALVACGGGQAVPVAKPAETSAALAGDASAPQSAPASLPQASASPADSSASASVAAAAPDAGARAKSREKPAQISARHILIQFMGSQGAPPSVLRTREQARAVAADVLRRAKSGEDFARLAVEFSDEPNAGARGGSLGRFGHGQMVKEFEDAAFALAPGEISEIVESPFGFHIIQRTE